MAIPSVNCIQATAQSEEEGLTERLFIAISPAMLKEIEDYHYTKRFKSQSAAARELLKKGLRTVQWEARKPR